MKSRHIALASVSLSLFAVPALGHHSFAMFDNSQTMHLSGTVTDFEWLNPHVWLHVSVKGEDGNEQIWSFEAGSTGQLQQSFWTPDSIKVGDVINDVGFHPLKDGSNGGQLLEVTKADGTYLCQGPECRERQEQEAAAAAAPPPEARAVPSFVGLWQRDDPYMQFMPPAEGLRGPPGEHPEHARDPNGEDQLPFIGNPADPLLLPWAAAAIEDVNNRVLVEQETVLPAHSLCWPSGVPGALRLREPVQFLQQNGLVTIAYQRDHQVRRVWINEKHPETVTPSWYGHSVGHYEGDTLVVDTIGLNDRTTVDWFNTPHTEMIHVVERYRIVDGGNTLEVRFTVTDPGAFTAPWSSVVHYRNLGEEAVFNEVVCAENNKDASTGRDYPVPMADLTKVAF
jgi:hypothetical protein